MTSMQVEGDSIATGTTAVRRQGSKQLDLLLLKAESYSKFILDNQQRAQAVQLSLYGTSSTATATAAVVATPPPTTGSAKKSTSKASSSKKRKANETEEAAASLSSAVTATPVKRAKETIAQPPNLVGGQLMPHQLEGLQWLLSLWENGLNGILAGKKILLFSSFTRICALTGCFLLI